MYIIDYSHIWTHSYMPVETYVTAKRHEYVRHNSTYTRTYICTCMYIIKYSHIWTHSYMSVERPMWLWKDTSVCAITLLTRMYIYVCIYVYHQPFTYLNTPIHVSRKTYVTVKRHEYVRHDSIYTSDFDPWVVHYLFTYLSTHTNVNRDLCAVRRRYGVATISRIDKIIILFCKWDL